MKQAIIVYVSICLMGLFFALASGIEWGTTRAGLVAFCTLLAASIAGVMTYIEAGRKEAERG